MASFPACVGCNNPFKYKGPQPNLLPCLHAVCSNCLEADVNSPVTCSVCQRSHDRSNQTFQVDQVVLAEVLRLTSEQEPAQISCTNKEDGNQAVCWCEECSDFLCEHCQISHAEVKISRNHKIWEISDVYETLKGSQARCSKHGLLMNIYDKDCSHFICSQCFYTDQPKHNTITSEEFATLEDQNLNKNLKSVTEKKNVVCQSTAAADALAKAVDEKSVRLRETVGHTFSELRTMLDQRQKIILLEVDQLMECMRTSNNNRYPVLQSIDTSCQTTIDYINKCLQYTSPQHILQLKGYIEEATQFCNSADVPQVHKDESSVIFSKQGLQDIRSAILSFGSLLAPIGQTGHPDENTPFQSAQLITLKRTAENLSSQVAKMVPTMQTLKNEVTRRGEAIKRLEATNERLQNIVHQIVPDGLTSDSSLHIIKISSMNELFIVKCPKMTLDRDRMNWNWVHLDNEGALVSGGERHDGNLKQLKSYYGTTTTSPLPFSGLVYWEVEADVDKGKLQDGNLVLEVGVCDEAVMDKSHYVGNQTSSCSLYLSHENERNNDVIVLNIAENGSAHVALKQNIQYYKTGSKLSFRFGVLYDAEKKSVIFLDSTNMKVLGCGRISKMQMSVWGKKSIIQPVFAAFYPTLRLKLISGQNIDMSTLKKQLLHEQLFKERYMHIGLYS